MTVQENYTLMTVWTNNVNDSIEEIDKLLDLGFAVRVDTDCMGHTRAETVKNVAKYHFNQVGAKPIFKDGWGNVWYATK